MTTEPIPRCPVGVIWWEGRILTYVPFNESGFEIKELSSNVVISASPELRAAIEADIAKQAQKAGRA